MPRSTATSIRSIEQREIDASLHAVERGLILGVEEARIAECHDRGLAAPLDRGAGQFDARRPWRTWAAAPATSGLGSSIAWHRCGPDCLLRRMAEMNSPWSISSPAFWLCSKPLLGGDVLCASAPGRETAAPPPPPARRSARSAMRLSVSASYTASACRCRKSARALRARSLTSPEASPAAASACATPDGCRSFRHSVIPAGFTSQYAAATIATTVHGIDLA